MRISAVVCDGNPSMASGFVVGRRSIATAAHVVKGARALSVQTETGELIAAHTIAYDATHDTALIETDREIGAQPLTLSATAVEQGSELLVLGYPLGVFDLRIAEGIVSGVNDSADYGDVRADRAFTTDAATNGGNSGGPVINRSGQVIGLVSGGQNWDSADVDTRRPVEGINFVVPADVITPDLAKWRTHSAPVASECADDDEPVDDDVLKVTVRSSAAVADGIGQSLFLHGESINLGSYESAWTVFTARLQRKYRSVSRWSSGLQSSYWTSLDITDVQTSGKKADAKTILVTQQESRFGYKGQTCSVWHITYAMKQVDGVWLIDDNHVRSGDPKAC